MTDKIKLLEMLASKQETLKEMLDDCPELRGSTKDDLIQDFYLFVYERDYKLLSVEDMFPKGEFNRGLVFTVLRNFIFGERRMESRSHLRRDDAYSQWKESKLIDDNSRVNNIAYESNLLILDELKKDLTEDEYKGILDLVGRNLLAKYTDKDGNRDMVAYGKMYRNLYRKYKEVKKKSSLFKYMTPEEVDDFEDFATLKFNN